MEAVPMERRLSSLELTALGVILKRAPCNAHTVVTEFAGSQTFAYRSGAGSIYPLLKRLTEIGLLSLDRKHYSLTEQGREAMRDWLRPPFPEADFSTNLDVLRSRAYFLKLLEPAEIDQFVSHCEANLATLLETCQTIQGKYQEAGDPFSEMAMEGTILETEARIEWIRHLGERFGTPRQ